MEKFLFCCYPRKETKRYNDYDKDFKDFFVTTGDEKSKEYNTKDSFFSPAKARAGMKTPSPLVTKSDIPSRTKTLLKDGSPSPGRNSINGRPELIRNMSILLKTGTLQSISPSSNPSLIGHRKSINHNTSDFKRESFKVMPILAFGQGSLSINDITIQESQELELEQLEGNILSQGTIRINALGWVNKVSTTKDGLTNFGVTPSKNPSANIDIILNLEQSKSEEVIFTIYFNLAIKQYFLSSKVSEHSRNILFVKLDQPFILKSKNIISLGDTHISLRVDEINNLHVEVIASKGENLLSRVFASSFDGSIRIGRSKSNEIVLNNKTLSRVQTTLLFNSTMEKWVIQDGAGTTFSMNGTWIFLDFEWEMVQELIYFRINKNFLKLRKILGK